MNQRQFLFSILACVFSSCHYLPSLAVASAPGETDKYIAGVRDGINTNWEPLEFYALTRVLPEQTEDQKKTAYLHPAYAMPSPNIFKTPVESEPVFSFKIDCDGKISNVVLSKSSGIAIKDLGAEDAILSSSPVAKPPDGVNTADITCDFSELKRKKHDCVDIERRKVLNNYWFCCDGPVMGGGPDADVTIFRFHLIPVEVLHRYPGVMKDAEVHSYKNVSILQLADSEQHLKTIKHDWSEFFQTHPSATTDQLQEEAKQLREKYDWLKPYDFMSEKQRSQLSQF